MTFLVRFALDAAWMAVEFGLGPRLRPHHAASSIISWIGWFLDHLVTIDVGLGHFLAWRKGPTLPVPSYECGFYLSSTVKDILWHWGPAALLASAAYALFAVFLAETCSPAPGEPRGEPILLAAASGIKARAVRKPAAKSVLLLALCCAAVWSALGALPYNVLNAVVPPNRLTLILGTSGLFIAGALVAMFVRKLPVVALCCFTLRIALNAVSLVASGSLPPLGNWWGAGGALLFVRRLVAIDTTTPLAISNWLGIGYVPVAAVAAIIFSAAYALFAVAFALTCNERSTEQSSGA
ncbi:MAG TPA: hypothetical protein VHV55_23815 [Pirellulales bacterium]|nr:hypothetical protein [Pirellulales bacterium]